MNKKNWAIVGLGFISQRHIQAIEDVGDNLIMACDIDDSKKEKVPDLLFFKDFEVMIESEEFSQVDHVAICTPNYLHFSMIKACLEKGKFVLCEKPLIINPDQLNSLPEKKLFTVLQIRHNPELKTYRESIKTDENYEVNMNICLHRGDFYFKTWKANFAKSGGLLFNIGIHYFDLLLWFFGEPVKLEVQTFGPKSSTGTLIFENAKVNWTIRIDAPMDNQIRRLTINGKHLDLTRHFENLHTQVYKDVKKDLGITAKEAGRSVKLVARLTEIGKKLK